MEPIFSRLLSHMVAGVSDAKAVAGIMRQMEPLLTAAKAVSPRVLPLDPEDMHAMLKSFIEPGFMALEASAWREHFKVVRFPDGHMSPSQLAKVCKVNGYLLG